VLDVLRKRWSPELIGDRLKREYPDDLLGMPAYHADPYSFYQRGSNENRNGMIRRNLPRKASLENLAQAELDAIVQEINDRPIKLLEYQTPNEAWNKEIQKLEIQSHQHNHTTHHCTST
jgi:transposase InsO family protein